MSLGQQLAPHLPFLRRYARALTGSQSHGDAYVRASLEAIVDAQDQFPRDVDPRLGLYRTFQAIWSSAQVENDLIDPHGDHAPEGIARARLAMVTPLSRQALLLTSMEGFSTQDTAYLIDESPEQVDALVGEADVLGDLNDGIEIDQEVRPPNGQAPRLILRADVGIGEFRVRHDSYGERHFSGSDIDHVTAPANTCGR